MLKPIPKGHHESTRGFFGWFNRTFHWGRGRYESTVHHILHRSGRFIILYIALAGVMCFVFRQLPTSFLPDEDQGILFAQVTTPPGSTLGTTENVLNKIRGYMLTTEKANVKSVLTVAGFSFGGRGQNAGIAFIQLKDWNLRPGKQNRVQAIAGRAMRHFMMFREALAFAFPPPAVIELGNANGFDFQLIDIGSVGHEKLMEARNQLLGMAAQSPALAMVRPNGLDDEPQYRIKIDNEKAGALGLGISDINNTLSAAWGSAYVNDFEDRGRIKRVFIQGQPSSRMQPEDFGKWYVRNAASQMVPFSAFASGEWGYGSPRLERFNGSPSMQIAGQPAPGKSSGAAMKEMEDLAQKLPAGVGFDWSGLSYEERAAGAQAGALYALSLLAQVSYEKP